jgi:hypothetical protein
MTETFKNDEKDSIQLPKHFLQNIFMIKEILFCRNNESTGVLSIAMRVGYFQNKTRLIDKLQLDPNSFELIELLDGLKKRVAGD